MGSLGLLWGHWDHYGAPIRTMGPPGVTMGPLAPLWGHHKDNGATMEPLGPLWGHHRDHGTIMGPLGPP